MNRFLFGRGWVYQDEATDGTEGGGGGGDAGVDDGTTDNDAGGDAGAAGAGAAGAKAADEPGATTEAAPKDMKSAIDAALGYKKGPNGEALDPLTGKAKEPAAGAAAKPAADGKETETHHANGAAKKNDKGEALDDKGQVTKPAAAPKLKTSAELALKPEEMKVLHAKTQARFGEVITTLKAHEATIAKQTQDIKILGEARDTILGVMEEVNLSQDQFANYLNFHGLLQSKNPKDLEQALSMIEEQRAALYKVLGREPAGGGVDLLAEFPDLQQKVAEAQLTREDALELAHSRRDKAARDDAAQRASQQQRTQTQTAEQQKAASTAALKSIETWTAELGKSDLDYKAKEDKLLAKVPDVIKNYTPALWLPTLKMLYEGIVIEKAQAVGNKGNQPLRPSGAKPGAKAPNSMLDAINQGLGYAGAAKG